MDYEIEELLPIVAELAEKCTSKERYRLGYEKLVKKVKETQNFYNKMIMNFKAYGNENSA